jgi:hypothetical protein
MVREPAAAVAGEEAVQVQVIDGRMPPVGGEGRRVGDGKENQFPPEPPLGISPRDLENDLGPGPLVSMDAGADPDGRSVSFPALNLVEVERHLTAVGHRREPDSLRFRCEESRLGAARSRGSGSSSSVQD